MVLPTQYMILKIQLKTHSLSIFRCSKTIRDQFMDSQNIQGDALIRAVLLYHLNNYLNIIN